MRTYCYPSSRRKGALRRGQALVEFALIAIIFFTMLLGMIQFGVYQSTANTLWNLSREGARYASVTTPAPSDLDIAAHVKQFAPPNIDDDKLTVSTYPATRVSGKAVEVDLTYDMSSKIFFPLVGNFLKKTHRYGANEVRDQTVTVNNGDYFTSSTMRVE